MKHYLLIACVILFLVPSLGISQKDSSNQTQSLSRIEKFDPKRDPVKDVQQAIVEAKKSNKRILLDVGGEWCIWCHRLDTLFMQNRDLSEFVQKNFVWVKINVSKENENKEFLSKYPEIPGYPHLFVLDRDGKLLHSQDTGALESGKHHDKDKVRAFLKQWAKGIEKEK